MDTIKCMRTRRSIRKFIDKEIDPEAFSLILEAGTYAPSSGNIQNWFFIVIKDDSAKEKLAAACFEQYWMMEAPVILVVVSDSTRVEREYGDRGKDFYSIQNVAATIQNMLLTAHEVGVGSCWVGHFDENAVKRITRVPDSKKVHAIIPLGYANERPVMPPRYQVGEIVFFGSWGNKLKDVNLVLRDYSEYMRNKINKGKKKVKKLVNKRLKK